MAADKSFKRSILPSLGISILSLLIFTYSADVWPFTSSIQAKHLVGSLFFLSLPLISLKRSKWNTSKQKTETGPPHNLEETQLASKDIKRGILTIGQGITEVSSASSETKNQSERILNTATKLSSRYGILSRQVREVTTEFEQVQTQIQDSNRIKVEIATNWAERIDHFNKSGKLARSLFTDSRELKAAIQEVKHVLQSIEEISEQTKLLALNAAIEASTSSKSGVGFEVVAKEVKDLANQTTLATKRISDHIGRVEIASAKIEINAKQISQLEDGEQDSLDLLKVLMDKQKLAITELEHSAEQVGQRISRFADESSSAWDGLDAFRDDVTNLGIHAKTFSTNIKDVQKQLSQTHQAVSKLQAGVNQIGKE